MANIASITIESDEEMGVHKLVQIHSEYYFDDDLVTFLVENTLFKVHKHLFLKYSEGFSDMFSACPPREDGMIEGKSDECPISLEGITRSEFTCLMDYFYHQCLPGNPEMQGDRLDPRWVDLLSVSTRFTANEARAYAITRISNIFATYDVNPVHKAIIATKHQVKAWLRPAYVEICCRGEPLILEEAMELGLSEGWKLMQAWGTCRGKIQMRCRDCRRADKDLEARNHAVILEALKKFSIDM